MTFRQGVLISRVDWLVLRVFIFDSTLETHSMDVKNDVKSDMFVNSWGLSNYID